MFDNRLYIYGILRLWIFK